VTTSSVPPSLDAPREERFNYGRWLERGGSNMMRMFGALTSSGIVTFVGWLFTQGGHKAIGDFHIIDAISPHTALQETVRPVLKWLALVTALCVAVMMWRLPSTRTPKIRSDEDEGFSRDVDLSAQDVFAFRTSFQLLLFTWFAFYFVLFGVHSSGAPTYDLGGLFLSALLDAVNNVSAMLMISCYVSLGAHRRTEVRNGYLVVDDSERRTLLWRAISGICVVTLVELVYVAIVAANVHSPHDRSIQGLDRVFAFVSGITCAVAYSLFAGRLDSRVIGAKMKHVVWLYIYAAIQPAWGVFFHLPTVEAVVLVFQLMLKGWLFLFVSWLLREDVLLFSVQRVRDMRRVIDDQRHDFIDRIHGRAHPRVSGVTETESIEPRASAM
jgi:hypothetical protein